MLEKEFVDKDVLVDVQGVSKKFCKDLKRSLRYGVQDLFYEVLGISKKRELRKGEFWAVKDVSFQLKRGECIGLIGHNGAGKSTLLKIINGLIKPDQGFIKMKGRIGALIELGAGFNPILTGRENVYINGQVLGFTKQKIDEKYQTIVDFAELHDFMESPVQNYSSGMKVRLGFAVAAQMEPDILIIDEVLAVGDVEFRVKCLNKISEIIKTSAVIFVSHTMPQIGRICSRAILMNKGAIVRNSSNVREIIDLYFNSVKSEERLLIDSQKVKLEKFSCVNKSNEFMFDQEINLMVKLKVLDHIPEIIVIVQITDQEEKPIAAMVSDVIEINKRSEDGITLIFSTRNIFNKGKYNYHLIIQDNAKGTEINNTVLLLRNIDSFSSISEDVGIYNGVLLKHKMKLI